MSWEKRFLKGGMTEEKLRYLTYNSEMLRYLKDPPKEIADVLIKREPWLFDMIKNPSREFTEYCLTVAPAIIKWVANPDEKWCDQVLEDSFTNILCISNIEYMNKHRNEFILRSMSMDDPDLYRNHILDVCFGPFKGDKERMIEDIDQETNV